MFGPVISRICCPASSRYISLGTNRSPRCCIHCSITGCRPATIIIWASSENSDAYNCGTRPAARNSPARPAAPPPQLSGEAAPACSPIHIRSSKQPPLDLRDSLIGVEHLAFVLPQFRSRIAFRVHQRLLALEISGHQVQIRLGHLNVVAKHRLKRIFSEPIPVRLRSRSSIAAIGLLSADGAQLSSSALCRSRITPPSARVSGGSAHQRGSRWRAQSHRRRPARRICSPERRAQNSQRRLSRANARSDCSKRAGHAKTRRCQRNAASSRSRSRTPASDRQFPRARRSRARPPPHRARLDFTTSNLGRSIHAATAAAHGVRVRPACGAASSPRPASKNIGSTSSRLRTVT